MNKPKHITVINDDLDFIDAIKALLEEIGTYKVNVIHEGEKAYQLVKENPPDLVILDIRMDQPARGWVILDMLRLDPATKDIPIIVCSATIISIEKVNWLKKHHVDVLNKPFDITDLQNMVEVNLSPPNKPSIKSISTRKAK